MLVFMSDSYLGEQMKNEEISLFSNVQIKDVYFFAMFLQIIMVIMIFVPMIALLVISFINPQGYPENKVLENMIREESNFQLFIVFVFGILFGRPSQWLAKIAESKEEFLSEKFQKSIIRYVPKFWLFCYGITVLALLQMEKVLFGSNSFFLIIFSVVILFISLVCLHKTNFYKKLYESKG
jgi:hypothetical protein